MGVDVAHTELAMREEGMQFRKPVAQSDGATRLSFERVLLFLRAPLIGLALLLIAAYLPDASFCLVSKLFGIGCPGCGGTRAVFAMCHGNFAESIRWNPGIWLGGIAATFHAVVSFVAGREWRPLRSGYVGTAVFCAVGIVRVLGSVLSADWCGLHYHF